MWTVNLSLAEPSPIEAQANLIGVHVSTTIGGTRLVVAGVEAQTPEEAHARALKPANSFLNHLAWKYNASLEIDSNSWQARDASPSRDGVTHISLHDEGHGTERVQIEKRDALSGELLEFSDSAKPGCIVVKWSEAAAYYRQAKLSNNVFDGFRNFYLVAENIADHIRQAEKPNEKLPEQQRLEAALKCVFKDDYWRLVEVTRVIPGLDVDGDIMRGVATFLYKAHRCQLNHSKASEDKKIPFDSQDEREVRGALPLIEFVAHTFLRYEEGNS